MGTRADYYVGKGEGAEWLGSTAWDGYPHDALHALLKSKTETEFRLELKKLFDSRDDATTPANGWPWPWSDSNLTDYVYAFFDGEVQIARFGRGWIPYSKYRERERAFTAFEKAYEAWSKSDQLAPEPPEPPDPFEQLSKGLPFPDMTSKQKVTLGKRSGVMVLQGPDDVAKR